MSDPTTDRALKVIESALDSSQWPASWAAAMLYLGERHEASGALREAVGQGHQQLLATANDLSLEQAKWKPGEDEWSVLENLQHVAAGNKNTARQCEALVRGEPVERHADNEDAAREYWDQLMGRPDASLADARVDSDAGHAELIASSTACRRRPTST